MSDKIWIYSTFTRLRTYSGNIFQGHSLDFQTSKTDKSLLLTSLFARCRSFSSSSTSYKSPTHYYDVLELTPKANHNQIKDSYYALSKRYHPDVNSSPTAHLQFQELSEAYEVLGSPARRRMYDRGVFRPGHASKKEEYHEHYKSPFTGGNFAKRKQKPPTGRTKYYNYDEFYRMHYNDNRIRYQHEKQAARDNEEMKKRSKVEFESAIIGNFLLVGFSFSVVVVLFCIEYLERIDTNHKKTSQK